MSDEQSALFGSDVMGAPVAKEKQWPTVYCGIWQADEVMSAFIKSIRLRETRDALYWFEVMRTGGADLSYIARRLCIEAQESGFGPTPAIYANAVFHTISIGKDHAQDSIFQLIVYLSKCKKWWEDQETQVHMEDWYRVCKEVAAARDGEATPMPIPEYAIDPHTKRGREMKKSGQKPDERFSGTERGIYTLINLFRKFGRVTKEDRLSEEEERGMRKALYAPFK